MSSAKTVSFLFVLLSVSCSTPVPRTAMAADQAPAYDKEQVKKDYKIFMEQLKSLNAQYKEITGEIGKVMKEEGVPAWELGDTSKEQSQQPAVQDLGGGAFLKETDGEMILSLDLPGYKRDSIKLSFQDGKKLLVNAQGRLETTARSYDRSFDLPVPGDQKDTSATYQDGVLTVKVPKVATKEVVIPIQ